jgi:membrane associated rhomboid family serine protease
LKAERAHTYSLVLASARIGHAVHYERGSGYRIHVPGDQRHAALNAITLYWRENPIDGGSPEKTGPHTFSAFLAAMIPAAAYLAVASAPDRRAFIDAFGADAGRIMNGELFRCFTALLLHADSAHLMANMAGTLLFGTYAAMLYGWGIGWLLIVLTGVQGNFMTAWWYGHSHLAVGASTAVFGALGLCAANTFFRRQKERAGRYRSWMPLAAALALVGWLGTSPRADIIAHFFGFGSGLLYGGIIVRIGRNFDERFQATGLLMAAALAAGSCLWGMYYNG